MRHLLFSLWIMLVAGNIPLLLDATSSPPLNSSFQKTAIFTPPPGWRLAEPHQLSGYLRALAIGKGPSSFPPTLSLTSEPYQGSLSQFIAITKQMDLSHGDQWQEIGPIQTQAGVGRLLQVDGKTQWGIVRRMHVILLAEGTIYILTAHALKDEFSRFYKDFFQSLRSLRLVVQPGDPVAAQLPN